MNFILTKKLSSAHEYFHDICFDSCIAYMLDRLASQALLRS